MENSQQHIKAMLSDASTLEIMHQFFSAEAFNDCWASLDKEDPTADDVETMLVTAHASLWHWKQRRDCSPQHLSVAYWQLAKVSYVAGNMELAKTYADKCVAVAILGKLSPFYFGHGYEVSAYAALLEKDFQTASELASQAQA